LGERISLLAGLGGALVLIGLYRIIRSRAPTAAVSAGRMQADSSQSEPTRDSSLGFLLAMTAPVLFGLAFVFRKWGWGISRRPWAAPSSAPPRPLPCRCWVMPRRGKRDEGFVRTFDKSHGGS